MWATLTGHDVHDAIVSALEFSPDGRTLATAAHDTSAWLWDTSPTRTARQICDRIARDLTPQEWRRLLPGVPRRQICKRAVPVHSDLDGPSSTLGLPEYTDRVRMR
ncbi:hypothetical protein [Streptomyces niveiscabiei]|uniref:hypothetical protein n=1 Tax=Streptomyces niveiscabiei TaxID=164115 RepID=UPI00389A38EA